MWRRWTAVLVMVGVAWGGLTVSFLLDWTPRLGLDLQGGTSVILEAPAGTDADVVEQAVEVMRRRIEDFGNVQEPEISITGGTSVLVQLPGVTDQERALDAVGRTGLLSFRPVLDCTATAAGFITSGSSCTLDDRSPILIEAAEAGEGFVFPQGVDPILGLTTADDIDLPRAFLPEMDEEGGIAAVYEVGPADLTGAEVENALPIFGQHTPGTWVVQLTFTPEGEGKFASITGRLAGYGVGTPQRRMAIVLDGQVVSAPSMADDVGPGGITGGSSIITFGAADAAESEARDLTTVLRYGSLPVAFERSAVQKVSATLGGDSLRAGLAAGIGGLILVVLFLLIYYRAMGLVTLIGLTVFGSLLVLVFGILGEVQGLTLTLAGVAGVIVAIGITADSYIVYFERVREEIRKGRTVVDAANEAYRRAFRTILTADFVSFAGALLLWALAVGPVRGFAQALGIATVLDVIVFYFFTRNAGAILVRSRLGKWTAAGLRRRRAPEGEAA